MEEIETSECREIEREGVREREVELGGAALVMGSNWRAVAAEEIRAARCG
jgi:hypothetical protein